MPSKSPRQRHLVIPDTQVRPGVPLEHFTWIGRAILEYMPDVIVHIGDHWDMSSLNTYDSPLKMEKRRLRDDISTGNSAMTELLRPLREYQKRRIGRATKQYKPRLVFFYGNHENRLQRTIENMPQVLDGLVSNKLLNLKGWETHPFLEPVSIDGVWYSHYFYNPNSGRAYGGTCHTKLRNIGVSFTMGHQQGLDIAMKHGVDGRTIYGLVCGSCYMHAEEYRGPQAANEWRGIIVKNDVRDGMYDIMPLSLTYLSHKFG